MDAIEKLNKLKQQFEALREQMPSMLKESFEELKPVVEDLNIAQLDRGERADGSILPNYSIVSVSVYGKRPGPMNLHNEGNFWRGITLEVYDNGVELIGRDMKTEMLQLRYGDEIIGLQDKSKEALEEDYLKEEIHKKIQTKFEKF